MWNVLLGFLPWILFSALLGKSHTEILMSTIVAAGVFLIIERRSLAKGYVLSWGTAAFFTFITIFAIVLQKQWVINNIWFISNAALALIIWTSLAIGKPFTLQYAREQTPKQFWHKPGFIRVNQILTIIWAVLLTLSALISLIPFNQNNLSEEILYQVSSYGLIALGVWFNNKIPTWYRNHKQKINNKNNPFLQGNYAPIREENDFINLPIEGEIPKDLQGIYMRNGPNPAFDPISYTYPFDGDGMIHAIYIDNHNVCYRNRYVKTKALLLEQRYGKAIYGGVMQPGPLNPKLIGPNDDPGPFKNGVFIHVIKHANRLLAMHETSPAYEIDVNLNTLGEWFPGTDKPLAIGPHTRHDPDTGDLYLIAYDIKPPYLICHRVNRHGILQESRIIDKPYSTMMHDFVMTENYLVFFDCPIVLDEKALTEGGDILLWRPELNTRIGILSRYDQTQEIIWIELPAFFVFHFANAYEQNEQIFVDFAKYQKLSVTKQDVDHVPPTMHRVIINLNDRSVQEIAIGHMIAEFPVFNLDYNTKPYRYIYAPTDVKTEHFNSIVKYDLETMTTEVHEFGENYEIGEAVFAPKTNPTAEDDGYIMLFVYDKIHNTSDFVILDAQKIQSKPIAKIMLPRRVPNGLHGSWFAN